MDKKYFFFDIDGTLAVGMPGKQYIPESTKLALKKLEENGHFIAIATGRSYAMAYDYMKELGFKNMVSDGGNGITINEKLIEIKPLDREKCIALINECKQKNIPWAFSPDNSQQRLTPDSRFYDFTQDTYMENIIVENLNPEDYEMIYKVYVACFKEDEEQIVSLKDVPHIRFHKEYIFVEPDDKSVGIKMVMDYFNAPYKDVVVFGDELNDLKMFRDEWTSIAMGNARDELKQRATFVTKNVDDDGIYYACKHFGYID